MRLLRFSAFFVFAIVQCAFAQNTQPRPTQQPLAPHAPDKAEAQRQPATSPNQNSQTSKDQQPVTPPAAKPFKFKFLPSKPVPNDKKLPTGFLDRGFRASVVSPEVQSLDDVAISLRRHFVPVLEPQQLLGGNPKGQFDRGIYADDAIPGTGTICGSIVSYNFSQSARGEMPKLESVTTCTPAEKLAPRRARDPRSKPGAPQLMQSVFQLQ
jgi:hypothetical protein